MASEQDYWNQMYANAVDQSQPHVLMRPKLYLDGDQWCALYGEDIQSGCCGFGNSPARAMQDFNKNWLWSKAEIQKAKGGV